jgi:hypothetical protein
MRCLDSVLTWTPRRVGLPKVLVADGEAADTFRMAGQPVSRLKSPSGASR